MKLIELSNDLLIHLRQEGFNSLIELEETNLKVGDDMDDLVYFLLKPSVTIVRPEGGEINGEYYLPLMCDEIVDRIGIPLVAFVVMIDDFLFEKLKRIGFKEVLFIEPGNTLN